MRGVELPRLQRATAAAKAYGVDAGLLQQAEAREAQLKVPPVVLRPRALPDVTLQELVLTPGDEVHLGRGVHGVPSKAEGGLQARLPSTRLLSCMTDSPACASCGTVQGDLAPPVHGEPRARAAVCRHRQQRGLWREHLLRQRRHASGALARVRARRHHRDRRQGRIEGAREL